MKKETEKMDDLNDLERAKLTDRLKQQEKEEAEQKQVLDNRAKSNFKPTDEQNNELKQLHYTLMEQKSYDIKYNDLVIKQMKGKVMEEFAGLPADLKQAKARLGDLEAQVKALQVQKLEKTK